MWKLKWKMNKEKWMLLMLAGAALLVIAMPTGGGSIPTAGDLPVESLPQEEPVLPAVSSNASDSYEAMLEQRVKEILKNVEGVGAVDVMIVLKASGEKVIHLDQSSKTSATEESDSAGGSRRVSEEEHQESAVLSGTAGSGSPIVTKELSPEISGIIISASGGGSPKIRAEITEAMEALFGVEANKVKVMERRR